MTVSNAASTAFSIKANRVLFQVGRIALGACFATGLIAALHPDVRSSMRGTLLKDFRTIVSTTAGDLRGNGEQLVVAKIKTRDSLFLEIYEPRTDGSQRLLERIELPDKKDGYFNFNGQASNLALEDIDADGRPEILVPTFDQNLVGRLNVYRYDASAGGFHRSLR